MKIFNAEVTRVIPSKKNAEILAIFVYQRTELSMPSSGLYVTNLDEIGSGYTIFSTNTRMTDFSIDKKGRILAVDDEGHLFSNFQINIKSNYKPIPDLVIHNYNKDEVHSYRITEHRILAVWFDEQNIFLAIDKGNVILINNDEITNYNTCEHPLKFYGNNRNNLFLLSYKNNLWHFNGKEWKEVNLPEINLPYISYTDILFISENDMIITSSNGLVLRGSIEKGFSVIDVPIKQYTGITKIDDKIFATIRNEGLFEITDFNKKWQLNFISKARMPLSLTHDSKNLLFTCAQENENPYFGVAELSNENVNLSNVFARSLIFD